MDLPLHTCIFGPLKFDHWLHSHSHRQACPRHHHPFYRRDDVVSVARSLTGGANVPPEDPDVQQKLVDIIRLETGKVRVSDYIDERSKLLADIAEQAMVESDLIAADALRGLDEASAKTIKAVDKDIEAVEKQLASARAEMEARQEDLATFEKRMEAARSEGLFFKGLYKPLKQWKDRDSVEQEAIKKEVKNIAQTTKSLLESKSRQNLYVFLIFVLGVFLLEGVASAEILWPRVIVLSAVIVFLSMQLIFEKFVSSGKDDTMER